MNKDTLEKLSEEQKNIYTGSIFEKLDKAGVVYAIGRSHLLGQRMYFIVTSKRFKLRVHRCGFAERQGTGLLEYEMTDDDILIFSDLKNLFTDEVQNEHGMIFELKRDSFKRLTHRINLFATDMAVILEMFVGAKNEKDKDKALREAKLILKKL